MRARPLPRGNGGRAALISRLIESVTSGWGTSGTEKAAALDAAAFKRAPRFPKGRYFSSSSCADELQDGPGFDGAALGEAQLGAAAAGSGAGASRGLGGAAVGEPELGAAAAGSGAGASGAIGAAAGFGLGFGLGFGAAAIGAAAMAAGAGATTLAAAFFAALFLAPAFLADFFGAAAFDFLADFLADFFADFLAFFADFFADFLADFFAISSFFLSFLFFLPPFFFLPLAIVILLLPPISVYRAFRVVRHQARGQSISSILAGDRLLPNREAQPCAPQELTCRRQSEPCIQYCLQQSCPA